MDDLDLRILRHMGMDPWSAGAPDQRSLSPNYLADRVGITPETVRERVRRMETSGVIAGYQAYPEPGQLDLRMSGMTVATQRVSDRKALIDELCLTDGIVEVHDLYGDLLLLAVGSRSRRELERRVEWISGRVGRAPWLVGTRPTPQIERALTHLDWRIVQALRGQAARSPTEVAEQVGVSYRTVKRRLDRMLDEASLSIVPQVLPERMAGVLPFDLVLLLEEGAWQDPVNAALKLFADRQIQHYPFPLANPPMVGLFLYAETLTDVEAMKQEAEGLDGVAGVRVLLTRTSRETGWMDEQVELKVRATAPGA